MSQQDGQTRGRCCTQQCCDMLGSEMSLKVSKFKETRNSFIYFVMRGLWTRLFFIVLNSKIVEHNKNHQFYRYGPST